MRSQPPLFLVFEACFLLLSFLCDYGVCFSLSIKSVFCSSVFYATMASAFPSPESLFCVPYFLSDHGLHLSFHNATLIRIMFMTLYPKWSPPLVSKSAHYTISARNNIMPWQSNTATSINYMASRSVLQTANHLRQPSDPLLNCLFSNINKYFQIPIKSFTMSVRHIHTHAQALVERERLRVA